MNKTFSNINKLTVMILSVLLSMPSFGSGLDRLDDESINKIVNPSVSN